MSGDVPHSMAKEKRFSLLNIPFIIAFFFAALVLLVSKEGQTKAKEASILPEESIDRSGYGEADISLQESSDEFTLTLEGHVGGRINKVVAEGDYAYFVTGPKVLIFDISDPTNPEKLGQTSVMPCLVEDLTIDGSFLYTANGECGIFIFDVSDSAKPYNIGVFDTGQLAVDIDVQGEYAYVADSFAPNDNTRGGLRIIDVSDKSNPKEIGSYGKADLRADKKVVVSGSYAYVYNSNGSGVSIMDISDSTSPTIMGFYDSPSYAFGLDIIGGLLYVADRDYGLRIVDVSNPSSPLEVGALGTQGYAYDVSVSNNYAYVANLEGLKVVDVTDPENPFEAGMYNEQTIRVEGVSVLGNYAYLADVSRGLWVINVENATNPLVVSAYDLLGYTSDVSFVGDRAFVAGGARGLISVDVSNPKLPTETGFYTSLEGNYHIVDTKSPFAYIGDSHCCPSKENMEVINISDPSNMTRVGDPIPWTIFGSPGEFVVLGNYLYVAKGLYFWIYDISNPSNPIFIEDATIGGSFGDVNIVGRYAYLPDTGPNPNILRIVDISDPENPNEVGTLEIPYYGDFGRAAVAGNYVYLVGSTSGDLLLTIDVSDPKNPTIENTYTLVADSGISDVQIQSNYAFLALQNGSGAVVLDVSNPTDPIEVASYTKSRTSGGSRIKVHHDKVYLVDSQSGLYIFDWGACMLSQDIDTDKDSLPDRWEMCGYDYEGDGIYDVKLPEMGANPNIKDIFVEIDYMVGITPILHSHQPAQSAIDKVVDAFEKRGIHLHVDFGPEADLRYGSADTWNDVMGGSGSNQVNDDPQDEPIYLSTQNSGFSWDNFISIKRENFEVERLPIFHYGLFAHYMGAGQTAIGKSPLPPPVSDFVVTLGESYRNDGETTYLGKQSVTFMHELGHNLGLCHSGPVDLIEVSCGKYLNQPIYISVMNSKLYGSRGIEYQGEIWHVDYSGPEMLSDNLDEEGLNETDGLPGDNSNLSDYGISWICPDQDPDEEEQIEFPKPANGSINWDCDNTIEGSIDPTNINGRENPGNDEDLKTYDDWNNLLYHGGCVGGIPSEQNSCLGYPALVYLPVTSK